MGKKILYKTGDKINKLTFIKEINSNRQPNGKSVRKGLFKCNCGIEKEIELVSVRNNRTISCGCYHKEISKKTKNKKHGKSKTITYTSWSKMKYRCSNPNNKFYYQRGIRVCQRWINSFEKDRKSTRLNSSHSSVSRMPSSA